MVCEEKEVGLSASGARSLSQAVASLADACWLGRCVQPAPPSPRIDIKAFRGVQRRRTIVCACVCGGAEIGVLKCSDGILSRPGTHPATQLVLRAMEGGGGAKTQNTGLPMGDGLDVPFSVGSLASHPETGLFPSKALSSAQGSNCRWAGHLRIVHHERERGPWTWTLVLSMLTPRKEEEEKEKKKTANTALHFWRMRAPATALHNRSSVCLTRRFCGGGVQRWLA